MDERVEKIISDIDSLHQDYETVFKSAHGERVLKDLEKICFVNTSTVSSMEKMDPIVLAYREGLRTVVLRIKQMIDKELISEQTKKLRGEPNV